MSRLRRCRVLVRSLPNCPARTLTTQRATEARLSIHTPTFQIYGANTDVGKTILSAGLLRSHLRAKLAPSECTTAYIKPLQTGDAHDEAFVDKNVPATLGRVHIQTLHKWDLPASPHIAARADNRIVSNSDVVQHVSGALFSLPWLSDVSPSSKTCETELASMTLIETAGGVLSPSATITPQADVYRPLRLPAILVGDPKLGGISSTLSAYESLVIRGYDVVAVAFMDEGVNSNSFTEIMKTVYPSHTPMAERNPIPVLRLPSLPPPEVTDLSNWYSDKVNEELFDNLYRALVDFQSARVREVSSLAKRGEKVLWWPFTQHQSMGAGGTAITTIDSAHMDDFNTVNELGEIVPLFDSCASWWTQGVGHGNVSMATSLAYAAGRYGHVIFPENVHTLAVECSEKIIEAVGGKWGSRAFFTDNGSTATEVAIKMAFKRFIDTAASQNGKLDDKTVPKLRVLAQAGCYHGDTLGVMNVASPSVFNEGQHPWFECKALIVDSPTIECVNGKYHVHIPQTISGNMNSLAKISAKSQIFSMERDSTPLYDVYTSYLHQVLDNAQKETYTLGDVGALMIEPVLMGAGGMLWVDPLFQRAMVRTCRSRGIPVIFDEVFAGFWRLGCASTSQLLGVDPDVACYAKLLTGGVVPMSVTVASADVFESFLGDTKHEALLHGHSYTAHPLGCASVLNAIHQYKSSPNFDQTTQSMVESWDSAQVEDISRLSNVHQAFNIGTVCVVSLKSDNVGYASTSAQRIVRALRQKGIFARPLGNVVYLMCAPVTPVHKCTEWLSVLHEILDKDACEN
eukprot:CFRG5964T1